MIETEHLEPENSTKAEAALKQEPLDSREGWVHWWSETTIQLDGNFTLAQLEAIIAVTRTFEEGKEKFYPVPDTRQRIKNFVGDADKSV